MCNVKQRQLALQLASVAACTRPPLLLLSEHLTRTLGANHIEGRNFLPSRAGQLGIYTSRSRQGPACAWVLHLHVELGWRCGTLLSRAPTFA